MRGICKDYTAVGAPATSARSGWAAGSGDGDRTADRDRSRTWLAPVPPLAGIATLVEGTRDLRPPCAPRQRHSGAAPRPTEEAATARLAGRGAAAGTASNARAAPCQ